MKKIKTPLDKTQIRNLNAGDEVLLNGTVYTARDQAHKRLVETINKRQKLPFELKGAIVYYCGPTVTPKGKIIGSCGPTTASRMDSFTPILLKAGLLAMIGKGMRSMEVVAAIKKHKAVYFLTLAGCGALLNKFVKNAKIVVYKDLGSEAILKLEVKDFPLIVGVDSNGRSVYG
ncbi:MAG: FumA C-terminus/TtdB family hydratase beta subunit [Candidatus Omnitrophota bacterium]